MSKPIEIMKGNFSMIVCKLMVSFDAPNFRAETNIGSIDYFEWLGNSWGLLYSHFSDFYPMNTQINFYDYNISNIKILGFTSDFMKFNNTQNIYAANREIAPLYSNSIDERVTYLINSDKKIEYSFAKHRCNGITEFYSSYENHIYPTLFDKIFGNNFLI